MKVYYSHTALFDWHLSFINQKNYNGCLLNKALVELWNNLNGMLLPANKNIVEWSDLEKII